jgi:hypothetical protein
VDIERVLRLAPLSGIVAGALLIVAFAVGGPFSYRPRGDEASAIFASDPGRIELGALIGGFYALVFLLIFVGTVAAAVRRSEGDAHLAYIALGGGIIAVIALAIGYRSLNAAAFQAGGDDGINPELATVMYRFYTSSFAGFVSFGLAALIGATGLAALHRGVLPTWLGWMSVVSAVGLMTPAHALFEGLALLWIIVVSVLLFRSPSSRRAANPAPDVVDVRNADRLATD